MEACLFPFAQMNVMKMTLTIDDDVASDIRNVQENEPEKSFERIVNELLRIGLESDDEGKGKKASE